jgi:MGT family glycosyltransferase
VRKLRTLLRETRRGRARTCFTRPELASDAGGGCRLERLLHTNRGMQARTTKSSKRQTVAMFCDGGFLAHVTRSFEVGRALSNCFGHRVIFCCSGPYSHIPRDAGFEVVPVFTVDRDTTMRLARRAGPCSLSWWRDACARSVKSDLDAIQTVEPDVVVGDMRWSLSTSARAHGVPYVAIANACWTSQFAHPIELPDGHFAAAILGKRLARWAFPKLLEWTLQYYALGYSKLRRHHGLPPLKSLHDAIEGDVTLLPDLPEFMPVVREAPPSFRYTGPLLWKDALKLPPWFERLDPKRPTLYFTMGSTGDSRFFDEAVRVFGNTEYQVLITTGGLAEVENPPPNVFTAKYAPGEALMGVSDVVVSHGGNGTVYQALSCGVPLIGFPTIFDQEVNMQRVSALGAGIQMSRAEYSGAALQKAVRTLITDERYRERCALLAARISRFDGRRRAALHIHDFLEHEDPSEHPPAPTETLERLPPLAPMLAAV